MHDEINESLAVGPGQPGNLDISVEELEEELANIIGKFSCNMSFCRV